MVANRSFVWIRVGSVLFIAALVAVGLRPAFAEELAETAIGREATESAGANAPVVGKQPSPQPTASPLVDRRMLLGHSALGRSIFAFELGDPTSRNTCSWWGVSTGTNAPGSRSLRV